MTRHLFPGVLHRFGQTLLAADDPRPVYALVDVLQPERLDALLLSIYGPDLMPSHKPVLVSQWSKYYFMQLIPPVVTASLLHDWHWPLDLARVAVALDERGVPIGVRLTGGGHLPFDASPPRRSALARDSVSGPVKGLYVPSGGGHLPFGASPPRRSALARDSVSGLVKGLYVPSGGCQKPFDDALLHDNLQPVITALSAYGGVAEAVLWGNAGDYLERCLQQLKLMTEKPLDAGFALLTHKTLPDGRRNPLFKAISYSGQPAQRQRRTCCLSYQVQWVGRCEHCPVSSQCSPDSAHDHPAG